MLIHVVKPDDTINKIAEMYNISIDRLQADNDLYQNYNLNVGQSLVIAQPEQTYVVKDGDTLQSIAVTNGVSIKELLRNNPYLSDRTDFTLYIGEELIIKYNKNKEMKVLGYTTTTIDIDTLKKTLPYLNYLTIFNYQSSAQGVLNDIDDAKIIQMAQEYNVSPIMSVSSIDIQGKGSFGITNSILSNIAYQNNLIDNIIYILKTKGYSGVNLSFYYILKEDLNSYINFIKNLSKRLRKDGYILFVTMSHFTFYYEPYTAGVYNYYSEIGKVADYVILLSFLWSSSTIKQISDSNYNYLKQYVDFALTQIPAYKIFLGYSRIAYDFELPYMENFTKLTSMSILSAMSLVNQLGVTIMFDDIAQTPYFYYYNEGIEHFVWYKDARTINSILNIISENNLAGLAIWNIFGFSSQLSLIINSQYNIGN